MILGTIVNRIRAGANAGAPRLFPVPRLLLLLLFFAPTPTLAQTGPALSVQWSEVNTQSDGTVIDPTEVTYTVYNSETAEPVCETAALTCTIDIGWSECMTLHATASQITTGLTSVPSNSVTACTEVRPDFPLSAPVITVTITNSP